MGIMLIKETFVNADTDTIFGEGDWIEPWTENRLRLFRQLQREYGKCDSKIYRDTIDGKVKEVGWTFRKRMEYEDARPRYRENVLQKDRTYIREVWVEVWHVTEPEPLAELGDDFFPNLLSEMQSRYDTVKAWLESLRVFNIVKCELAAKAEGVDAEDIEAASDFVDQINNGSYEAQCAEFGVIVDGERVFPGNPAYPVAGGVA